MMTVDELRAAGWRALVKELGVADALRYRILFEQRSGDYVRERKELFAGMNLDQWLSDLARWEKDRPPEK